MLGDFPLDGKIVVITGGASGIGLAFAKLALASGARVIIADLALSPAAEPLVRNDPNVRFIKCDVQEWDNLEALIPFAEKEFGDVPDVYAANAGVGEPEWSSFWGDRETKRYAELDINLGHPIKLSRIAIRACLRKNKKGVVIVTSSIAGVNGHFATALYVASKHGTIGLIKSLAKAETEAQVKVVGICPGLVETPLLKSIMESQNGDETSTVLIKPSEIAERMKDLIEKGTYRGGMALAVARPGDATIVADGSTSLLEDLLPSDLEVMRKIIAAERGNGPGVDGGQQL
ncbi:hypothetical protein NCS57_00322300 [Fusarium keratoplasticum]|uniref:Uncharacterized protein n=1 Tax=Fusarium keratoplasticum TaxID=1328300 RepID=A0ACC0RCA0_9HYPO|nr:hypothetical protein NCS57_00322300 [Fusarium keratoplasticum]KAI8680418.1 hypothetical protein NCS57_00322300 [Fusarium keratoplasticum]KAI8686481.1 hypothetical protein NCS55_00324000 [Fusarium keratoplasticum]